MEGTGSPSFVLLVCCLFGAVNAVGSPQKLIRRDVEVERTSRVQRVLEEVPTLGLRFALDVPLREQFSDPDATKAEDLRKQVVKVSDLPGELREIGIRTFGSAGRLSAVLAQMSEPANVTIGGVAMKLVHASGEAAIATTQEDSYKFREINEQDGVVIDVGANIGDTTITAAKLLPGMQVIAAEPVPDTFFYMCYNLFLNKVPILHENELGHADKFGVLPLHAAIRSHDGNVNVGFSTKKSQSAGADFDAKATVGWQGADFDANSKAGWQVAEVREVNFTSFLASHGVQRVRLMKMDCEGCEYSVIPELGSFFSDKAKLERFRGEIHQSLKLDDEFSFIKKPSKSAVSAMDAALAGRGCTTGAQYVSC